MQERLTLLLFSFVFSFLLQAADASTSGSSQQENLDVHTLVKVVVAGDQEIEDVTATKNDDWDETEDCPEGQLAASSSAKESESRIQLFAKHATVTLRCKNNKPWAILHLMLKGRDQDELQEKINAMQSEVASNKCDGKTCWHGVPKQDDQYKGSFCSRHWLPSFLSLLNNSRYIIEVYRGGQHYDCSSKMQLNENYAGFHSKDEHFRVAVTMWTMLYSTSYLIENNSPTILQEDTCWLTQSLKSKIKQMRRPFYRNGVYGTELISFPPQSSIREKLYQSNKKSWLEVLGAQCETDVQGMYQLLQPYAQTMPRNIEVGFQEADRLQSIYDDGYKKGQEEGRVAALREMRDQRDRERCECLIL